MGLVQDTTLLKKICTPLKWELPKASVGSGLACAAFLLLAVYIWILPIGHTTALRNLIFFLLVFLTMWAAWKRELRPRFPIAWAWGVYGVVAVLSLFYAIDPGYSLFEIKTELIYGILVFILGATWIRNEISLNRLMVLLLLGNAFLVGYAIFQGAVLFRDMPPIPRGSLNSDFGTFSTYLVTALPFVVAYFIRSYRNRVLRVLLLTLLVANCLAIYYTISRAAVLAIMAEIGIAALFLAAHYLRRLPWRKSMVFGALVIVAMTGLTMLFNVQMIKRTPAHVQIDTPTAFSQDPRVTILWPAAIENIRAAPLTGGGFGRNAYKLRNPEIAQINQLLWHAHNMFLNKGVQMGIPGILAFSVLLAALAWAIWPTRTLISSQSSLSLYAFAGIIMIVGVIIKNLTDDYFVRDNALLFWLMGGALAGAMSVGKRKKA